MMDLALASGDEELFGSLRVPSTQIGGIPGSPKEPKIMAQDLKIESIGSIGSIILPILEVQVYIASILGIVAVILGICSVFGYLEPQPWDPSAEIVATWGPTVCRSYLLWAVLFEAPGMASRRWDVRFMHFKAPK